MQTNVQPSLSPAAPPAFTAVGHWRATALVAGLLGTAYLLLLNPYWTPGGDSELYVSAARSITSGEGYTYNGKPVRVSPPAWPYLLAAVFSISPTFLAAKATCALLMAGAWTVAHRVLLRLAPPAWATWSAVVAGILVPVYSLTFWLHSDALFCLVGWTGLLLAARVAEASRARRWELLGLVVLCGLLSAIRWTGGLQWGLIAAMLGGGIAWTGKPLRSRPVGWRIGAGVLLTFLATALVLYVLFKVVPANAAAQNSEIPVTGMTDENATPELADNTIFKDLTPMQERFRRIREAGHWPAWLLWYPTRFAGGLHLLDLLPIGLGWSVLLLLLATAIAAMMDRGGLSGFPLGRFLWPALILYILLLVWIWPLPNARYLVPVAPLVIAGTLHGCRIVGLILSDFSSARHSLTGIALAAVVLILIALVLQNSDPLAWIIALVLAAMAVLGRKRPHLLGGLFLASLLGINLIMLAVDVAVQRSGDRLLGGSGERYYHTYETGTHVSLLKAVGELRDRGIANRELAVSERYLNLNRMRFSKAGPRNVVMLLNRDLVWVPDSYSFPPGQIPDKVLRQAHVLPDGLAAWAQARGVRYYLYQQPARPWRLWHFRVPMSLQQTLGGSPYNGIENLEIDGDDSWGLYELVDGYWRRVELPQSFPTPTRVADL